MNASAHIFKRGDRAVSTGAGGVNPEEVEILGGSMVTLGTGSPEWPLRQERWLRVRFADSGVLVTHPSNLAPIVPLADIVAAHPVGGAAHADARVEAARTAIAGMTR